MKTFRGYFRAFLTFALFLAPCATYAQEAAWNSGIRTESVTYLRADRTVATLPVAIWYPTDARAGWYRYPFLWGRAALNAPPRPGPWPLIVYSHGVGDCGVASGYLLEAFARSGYIVAAVDHDDAASCLIEGGTRPYVPWNLLLPNKWNFPFRTDDLQAVINTLVSSPDWAPLIDPTRIAAAGHSLGGWTIGVLEDPRIQARVLLAPPYQAPSYYYGSIPGPKLYLLGEYHSNYSSPLLRTWAFDHSSSPKYLGYVGDGDHYSFTDKSCGLGDSEACASRRVQSSIISTTLDFLDYYVEGGFGGFADLLLRDPGILFWKAGP